MNTTPENEDGPEERALYALIALALHPRSEEITPLVVKKMDEIDADIAALRAKGCKIERSSMHSWGWEYVHDDYDGAPDSGDSRCGWGTLLDCIGEMKALDAASELMPTDEEGLP